MAELRATPMVNPVMGLLADRLKKVQQFGAKPFGYENPPVEMLMNLLGVPAVQQTMERMAYGEPLTTGRGMTTKPRAEAVEAAMAVAPVAGLLGKATKGLPVGASIESVGNKNVNVSLNEASNFLSAKSKFGEVGGTIRQPDKLSDKPYLQINYAEVEEASRGTGKGKELYKALIDEAESRGLRVFSDSTVEKAAVNVYKSLGKGGYKLKDMTKGSLDDGTVYGAGAEKPAFEISNKKPSYPQQEALDTAQRNAALPIEEGGLGLPKDNTPEMRAAAMGFDTEVLHGTAKDFTAFDLSKAGTNTRQAGDELGIFSTSKPFLADNYAQIASKGGWAGRTEPENAVVYPLVGSFKNPKKYQTASEFYRDADAMAAEQKLGQWREQLQKEGYDSVFVRPDLEEVVAFNPSQLRSRFAAFDPMRRNEADILAGVLPLGLLADEEQRKKIYELMPSLLGQ